LGRTRHLSHSDSWPGTLPASNNGSRIPADAGTIQNNGLFQGPETLLRKSHALLDLDLRAHFLELLLDVGGVVLRDAFLERPRRAVHEVLGLLQPEARDLPDDLDRLALVARRPQHDRQLELLFLAR